MTFICLCEVLKTMSGKFLINFLIAYCGENVKEVILGKLNANSFIYNLWDTLTKDVCNKHLTENIKLQILEKWTNIRINVQNMHYMYRSWEEKLREMKHQETNFRERNLFLMKRIRQVQGIVQSLFNQRVSLWFNSYCKEEVPSPDILLFEKR